jgi:hypothetical protein
MRKFRLLLIFLVLLVAGLLAAYYSPWFQRFLYVDQCYDTGGAIAADGKCEGGHPWGEGR